MAINYSFIDSALYGTDDINSIAQNLTGAGVMPFLAKDSYNVSDLNALTSTLVSTGVQLNGCACSVENAGTAEMIVRVEKGIVFFESGVSLTVDGEGYTIAITANKEGYVYAYYRPSLQKADIVFEEELPTDGEYVLLAEILENGTLTDKRSFARSKVATLGKNVTQTPSFNEIELEVLGSSDSNIYIVAEAPVVDLSRFNYALVYSPANSGYQLLNLNDDGGRVYLEAMYDYGPINYAQAVGNRLCVTQTANGGKPYLPQPFSSVISRYKIILV